MQECNSFIEGASDLDKNYKFKKLSKIKDYLIYFCGAD